MWRFTEQGKQVWLPGFVFKTRDIKTSARISTILCALHKYKKSTLKSAKTVSLNPYPANVENIVNS
jgi:hypothetical protein